MAARTYDEIYTEICDVLNAKANLEPGAADFWNAQATHSQRLRELWHEIAERAVVDKSIPNWARFAAVEVREGHARQVEEYHRLAKLYDD